MKAHTLITLFILFGLAIAVTIGGYQLIGKQSSTSESPTSPTPSSSPTEVVDIQGRTFQGKLTTNPDTSDVAYPYLLTLETPLTAEADLGGDMQPITVIGVVPDSTDNDLAERFEELVGQNVTVQGNILWGYAESRYIEVQSIEVN